MQTNPKRSTGYDLRRLVGSVNQLRFNDNKGEVSFFGQKMIILRRDVIRIMREALERLVGDQSAPFLSYLASGIGVHEGSIFRESIGSTGEQSRQSLENLVHSALEDTNLGLGKIRIDGLDFDKSSANIVVANCFEATENGSSEEPNCIFTSGFLAGIFAEVLDKTVQAKEIRCISQGATECEFQISLVETGDGQEAEMPKVDLKDVDGETPLNRKVRQRRHGCWSRESGQNRQTQTALLEQVQERIDQSGQIDRRKTFCFYRSQRRREWDSNPRGRDAQRLSCPGPYLLRSRGRRFNHSAIPAWSATRMSVLNHFRNGLDCARFFLFCARKPCARTLRKLRSVGGGEYWIVSLHPFRIKMVRDYSISKQNHSVSERVLIGEVRPDLVFLAK